MAYNDTPLPTETPSASQNLLRQNFNQIATSYNTDHVALTSAVNIGQHKQVTLANVLAADPNQIAPVCSVYTKTASGSPNLFFQNGALAANAIQLTRQGLTLASGEGFIPGGLQIRCGSGSASIAGTTNNFSSVFPTACIAVALAADNANNIVQVFTKAASNFSAKSAQGNCSLYYIAIGY